MQCSCWAWMLLFLNTSSAGPCYHQVGAELNRLGFCWQLTTRRSELHKLWVARFNPASVRVYLSCWWEHKQFTGYINLVFSGEALFLVCTDGEFERFFMELITAFLQDDDRRSVYGARFVSSNVSSSRDETWVRLESSLIGTKHSLNVLWEEAKYQTY